MHISLRRPDFNKLGKEIKNIGTLVSQAETSIREKSQEISNNAQINSKALNSSNNKNKALFADTKYAQLSTLIEQTNDQIANPFEQLSKLFNQSELINIQTKTLTVKIPIIYSEDINAYEIYLRQWGDRQQEIIEERKKRPESLLGVCLNMIGDEKPLRQQGDKTAKEKAAIKQSEKIRCEKLSETDRTKDTACKVIACEEKIQPIITEAENKVLKLFRDYENTLDSINANILTLQEYRNFPFELYEWIHVIDRYLAEIAALLNNFFGYVSYWMLSNANRFSAYVDAIILIMNVIQTYQVLIDFSANRSSKCATCTNDTYDQHTCTLSILCQGIKLPI
ncbi:MAG: hypothetical protein LBD75_07990, partial [Candidatus Peribacteria bacterium]|nr:hypothetical protein [Candidatus Peribacteria bacterium]